MIDCGRIPVLLGFAILLLFLSLNSVEGRLITVCSDGCNFASISPAVDFADPGDVVEVRSGIYKENVRIEKNIKLIGMDAGTGMPAIDAGRNDSAVTVLGDGATLRGFNLTNAIGSPEDFYADEYAGIRVWANETTIESNLVSNSKHGILITDSLNASIRNNELVKNEYGIRIKNSRNISAIGNEMRNNRFGLLLESSENNLIQSNAAEHNIYGIKLNDSQNNALVDNLMNVNKFNFGAEGYNDVGIGNLVDSRPILYLFGIKNETIDSSIAVGAFYCYDCENITVKDLNLSNNFHGIYLCNSSSSNVMENVLDDIGVGISLIKSYDNSITDNQINRSAANGISLIDSAGTKVENNIIKKYNVGIYLLRSAYSEIKGNSLINGSIGVHFDSSWSNNVTKNLLSKNRIALKTESTEWNKVSLNDMINNSIDVSRWESDNDTLQNVSSAKEEVKEIPTAGVDPTGVPFLIDSEPPGADVLIEGDHQEEKTNGLFFFPSSGNYTIELRLGKQKITKEIQVKEGKKEWIPFDN
jgi:parallel beta-helix repeat protein